MRRSVRIKNTISKVIMTIAAITFICIGSNTEGMDMQSAEIAFGSMVIGWLGYQLYKF